MKDSLKIMDLPRNERPRERMLRYGASSLSNAELLAVVLRSGTTKQNAVSLSNSLLKNCNGLNGLLQRSAEELMELDGIGEAKAAELLAIAELAKRFKTFRSGERYRITQPKDVADLVMEEARHLQVEVLKVMMLNVKNEVISIKDVSVGSLNSSIVHPREVFFEAIRCKSASIIICHNHPSGDPSPSGEDMNVTRRIKECGTLLGIDLLDHVVIGDGTYVSLKEKGIL